MNENGQRLLELCCFHRLCVTNTFFQNKTHHKASWRHPRSKHWHQLDLIITKRDSLNTVHNTRAFHSADCDTDHALIISKAKIKPKRLHHMRKEGLPKINTAKTTDPATNTEFTERLRESLPKNEEANAEEHWESLKKVIFETAVASYGKKEHKNTDWFEANFAELKPIIEAKRQALICYKKDPNRQNYSIFKAARKNAQQAA